MNIDDNVIVGVLTYTNYTGQISKVSANKIISLCFYKNAITTKSDSDIGFIENVYIISAGLVKKMYMIGNNNVCLKIESIIKSGIYRELFRNEEYEWYMSIILGGNKNGPEQLSSEPSYIN